MPCSRNEDLPQAIDIFLSQDYQDKQLIIGLDSLEGVDLSYLPDGSNVHTFYEGVKETIGTKRNRLCGAAHGDIIVHFDSDDWYAPDFITQSVNHLLTSGADVTGLSKAYFYQREPEQAWLYDYTGTQPYVIGSGMCYHKSVWERNPFKDVNAGEDRLFLANAGRVIPHNYITGFLAFIHGNNTESHKALRCMKPVSPDYVKNSINFTM